MISAPLGQIIRIFYKENSPPRGSSRDRVSQGELFSLAGVSPCCSCLSLLVATASAEFDQASEDT